MTFSLPSPLSLLKLPNKLPTKSGTGTWDGDVGLGDSRTRGRGDVGTWGRRDSRTWGRGDSERWDASTSKLGDAWGFEDVINK